MTTDPKSSDAVAKILGLAMAVTGGENAADAAERLGFAPHVVKRLRDDETEER